MAAAPPTPATSSTRRARRSPTAGSSKSAARAPANVWGEVRRGSRRASSSPVTRTSIRPATPKSRWASPPAAPAPASSSRTARREARIDFAARQPGYDAPSPCTSTSTRSRSAPLLKVGALHRPAATARAPHVPPRAHPCCGPRSSRTWSPTSARADSPPTRSGRHDRCRSRRFDPATRDPAKPKNQTRTPAPRDATEMIITRSSTPPRRSTALAAHRARPGRPRGRVVGAGQPDVGAVERAEPLADDRHPDRQADEHSRYGPMLGLRRVGELRGDVDERRAGRRAT